MDKHHPIIGNDVSTTSSSSTNDCRQVSKVIKGEIHNVLSIMRADPRYAKPSRFHTSSTSSSIHNTHDYASAAPPSEHPLITSLRKLAESSLTSSSYRQSSSSSSINSTLENTHTHTHSHTHLDSLSYLSPFCTAVSSRDISAAVTGAALGALYKFLLYGFIDQNRSTVKDAKEGITVIARCIRHCSFEETPEGGGKNEMRLKYRSTTTTFQPAIQNESSSHHAGVGRRTNRQSQSHQTAYLISDEEVVLKLLSLAALVIRSSAGALLESNDVVGILDTCLHVATRVGEKASGLLKTAAADCLGGIVLVVFSRPAVSMGEMMRDSVLPVQVVGSLDTPEGGREESDDSSDGKSENSDDMWCNAEKEQDEEGEVFQDLTTVKSTSKALENQHSLKPIPELKQEPETMILDIPTTKDDEHTPAIVIIMSRLASLVNPFTNSDQTCTQALQLINIALETCPSDRLSSSPQLLHILKDTLCKHLLYISTTSDLIILTLVLRLIYNLFFNIPQELKVQLEIFLTSVHIRILDEYKNSGGTGGLAAHSQIKVSPERREVALESLVEFCNEPALMQDLYVNYDCDEHCTNLFETICRVLCSTAIGSNILLEEENKHEGRKAVGAPPVEHGDSQEVDERVILPPLNILNTLACEGILTVINSIESRCDISRCQSVRDVDDESCISSESETLSVSNGLDENPVSLNFSPPSPSPSDSISQECTSRVLVERKRRKHKLATLRSTFNNKPLSKEWIKIAEGYGIFSHPATPSSVATFLYSTPKLDKMQIGVYLSKGPKEKYPFHSQVLTHFLALFDFRSLSFSEALRTFLFRFRLPGEAQCIDRLMDSFAARLYEQYTGGSSVGTMMASRTDSFHFRNADSVFVLAFSTIMLNTDLHNPTIKDERRMTLEQFINNNRGINDGEDFPVDFMTALFNEIKNNEIQVQRDASYVIDDTLNTNVHWTGIFSTKSAEVAAPIFTSYGDVMCTSFAGVHERDMFKSIANWSLKSMFNIFERTLDNCLVLKLIKGFKQMSKICVYFRLDKILNEIITKLLEHGMHYITSAVFLESCGYDVDVEKSVYVDKSRKGYESIVWDDDDGSHTNLSKHAFSYTPFLSEGSENGCSDDKGLLCLNCALSLVQMHTSLVREAWPTLVECVFALRDANALPEDISVLDDFSDSSGRVFPPSKFSISSHNRASQYIKASFEDKNEKLSEGSWWFLPAVFKKQTDSHNENDSPLESVVMTESPSPATVPPRLGIDPDSIFSCELRSIVEATHIDHLFNNKHTVLISKQIVQTLLDTIDENEAKKQENNLVYEHRGAFALELAAKSLFANAQHASELYPLFVAKLDTLSGKDNAFDPLQFEKFPFLMERFVVFILRSIIHLNSISEVKAELLKALPLISNLPPYFSKELANRLGCGMAIILQDISTELDHQSDWNVIDVILEQIAQCESGRQFVFDGIASFIDSHLPEDQEHHGKEKKKLSYHGASLYARILLKFVFGSYDGDMIFCTAALPRLGLVYWYIYDITTIGHNVTTFRSVPDEDLWLSTCSAFYSLSFVENSAASIRALDTLEKLTISTIVTEVTDASWLALMETLTTKQPPIHFEVNRIKAFRILSTLVLVVLPELEKREENWAALTDIAHLIADHGGESLRAGRNGSVSELFESTVETMTNTTNVLTILQSEGNAPLISSIVEIFTEALERVGATGGLTQMVAATI